MISPTLDDLKAAQVTLQAAVARQDGYDGNNPAKHATAVRLAREEVNRLTRALKASGVLTRTAHEQLRSSGSSPAEGICIPGPWTAFNRCWRKRASSSSAPTPRAGLASA